MDARKSSTFSYSRTIHRLFTGYSLTNRHQADGKYPTLAVASGQLDRAASLEGGSMWKFSEADHIEDRRHFVPYETKFCRRLNGADLGNATE